MSSMYNFAPPDYRCPFCVVVAGRENSSIWTRQQDIVLRDELVTAFIAAAWWPNNPGHVLVVPNEHFENLFELPAAYAAAVHTAAQQIGHAFLQSYGCEGVSTRQHNGPAGNQDVWHYHLHVFPRHRGDRLYELTGERRTTTPEERLPYAERMRAALTWPSPPAPLPR